jgi:sorbitol/mannitol transport system permease protein
MARAVSNRTKVINTAIAGTLGFLMFFPILWIIILSFKTEEDAIRAPLEVLFSAGWTTENFVTVQERSDYFKHFSNSVIIALGSTLLGLVIAIPAAWSMAFVPSKHTKDLLMWMLSTKMMPAVGVLIPMYLLFQRHWPVGQPIGLVMALMLMNLPIIIWMLYTYFKEIPARFWKPRGWTGRL